MLYKTRYRIFLTALLSVALLPLTAYAQQPTARTFLEIGITNNKNAEFSEAIDSLKKALNVNPIHVNAYMKLGNIYIELEQYQDATDTYKKVLKIKSENSGARYNLGVAYLGLSKKYMSAARKQQNALKKLDKYFATDLANKIKGKK